ncbi:MAG: hypothetical protein K2G93_04040 [Rikenella sp.]|nr:hypothetical protein [Rikenella sp.]
MGTIERLRQELKTAALRHDLCGPWQRMLDRAADKATLVQMYMRGIDFCFGWDFPTVEYIERHFKGECERYGLHVNETFRSRNERKVALVGRCDATLDYDRYEVAQVFVKHDSHARLDVRGHSLVTVDCFDASRLDIRADEGSRVTVYRYGDARVTCAAQPGTTVEVVDKHKNGYYD